MKLMTEKIKIHFISVVMATYNREKTVKQAVESVLKQTYKNFEFIIIDDCSSDNTPEIIEKYAQKDNRINFIKNSENLGCTKNNITLMNMAKGKYVAHMDDDDICDKKRLEKQVKFLEENPDVAAVGTFIEPFGEKKEKSWVTATDCDLIKLLINFYNPFCHPSTMFNKEILDKYKINYCENAVYSSDYEILSQITIKNLKISNIPEKLLKYRMHKNRITDNPKSQEIQTQIAKKIKTELFSRFFEDNLILEKCMGNLENFPFGKYDKEKIVETIELIKNTEFANNFSEKAFEKMFSVLKQTKNEKYLDFFNEKYWR